VMASAPLRLLSEKRQGHFGSLPHPFTSLLDFAKGYTGAISEYLFQGHDLQKGSLLQCGLQGAATAKNQWKDARAITSVSPTD
jgi:hypothetical protein